jgi:nitroreductase
VKKGNKEIGKMTNENAMSLKDLVFKTRSYRRFEESYHIDMKILEGLVDLARMSASAANRQPLKYLLYNTPGACEKIFPSIAWAAYLKDWSGPVPGERPSAYIIILGDKSITESFSVDHGIAAQSIMLGATEAGLGGCMIASIKREALRDDLKIPDRFDILLILAIGKPAEKIIIDEIINNDVKYWRDDNDNHHVPKRPLDELIIKV